jgi:hypothetical protein
LFDLGDEPGEHGVKQGDVIVRALRRAKNEQIGHVTQHLAAPAERAAGDGVFDPVEQIEGGVHRRSDRVWS